MRLNDIHMPVDATKIPPDDLENISDEIRQKIIDTVSKNGGHLASNLGAVELTLALHMAFDFSRDRLIFDVGHQCYTHKLLTGRDKIFDTLRQFDGMAGFPRRSESEYDMFDTGHASTAISAAVGMARARDLKKENYHVVAVVGDGALTGGMCYEALNDAGSSRLRMIVVLNDNGMSISRNVGAVSKYLTHMRSGKGWYDAKYVIGNALKKIPVVGNSLHAFFQRIKNSLRNIFVQDRLFDSLGFHYLGPVDGRDTMGMKKLFDRAKLLNEPVLIHVITKKGDGYTQAELNPTRLHGTPPFDVRTGEPLENAKESMSKAAGEALCELMEEGRNIAAVTAAMTDSTGLGKFAKKYPKHLFDVGIAEEHAVTMAAGLASCGIHPFVAIYDTFLQRAYDQILLDVCQQNLPVCFLIDRAGMSEDGITHHGVYGLSYLRDMPNLILLQAGSRSELKTMIRYAAQVNGPVAIRYAKTERTSLTAWKENRPFIPEWRKLRNGKNVLLLACGDMCRIADGAAEMMQKEQIFCGVWEANIIKPLDDKALEEAAAEYSLVVTLEEGVLSGGFGESVAVWNANHGNKFKIKTIGLEKAPETQGNHELQMKAAGIDTESVTETILQWYKENQA